MAIVNNKKIHEYTLTAISTKDKLNKDHKPCGESFICNKQIYLPLCGCNNMPVLYRRLLDILTKQTNPININVNSFLELTTKEYYQTIITMFFSIDDFFNNKYSLKTTKQKKNDYNFIIDENKYAKFIKVARVIVEAEHLAKRLMTMPGNYLTIDEFEKIFREKFKGLKNIKFSVVDKNQLTKKKMGLILGVGKASPKENYPRIIVVEYNNAKNTNKLALVGKGIVFDTGGLNLKPSEAMMNMHTDMAGAAISLSSIYAMAKLGVKANVVGLATLASNEISENSYRCNDVLTSYSGTTVEILNTDAEGRLALADGVSFAAKDLHAKTIMTIATLTGAITIGLGETYTGMWTSNDKLWNIIYDASNLAADSIWRMPFHFEYKNAIINNSKIADIANMASSRLAGASTAAEFLHYFAKNVDFIHADVAGSTEYHKQFFPTLVRTLIYLSENLK